MQPEYLTRFRQQVFLGPARVCICCPLWVQKAMGIEASTGQPVFEEEVPFTNGIAGHSVLKRGQL